MIYSVWLFGLSALFVVLERLLPRDPRQGTLRVGILDDLAYIVFNGNYLGVLIGGLSANLIVALDHALDLASLKRYFYLGFMSDQPLWLQIAILLPLFDLVQYGIHNLLHRVGWLWEFHKVHHSIVQLDWIGNWRFHLFEGMVYRTLLYPAAAFFGFSGPAFFWVGLAGTLAGHFAHANLRVHVGPLKYVVNSPEMHIWHHCHPESGPPNRNFGITLSVWDWLFGTAYVPGHDPERLGFEGIERYPRHLPGQIVAPILRY